MNLRRLLYRTLRKKDDRCIETSEAVKETFSASKGGYRISIYHGDSFYKLSSYERINLHRIDM